MSTKLYVGNLPFSFDDQTLNTVFAAVGNVTSAKVLTDRATGRSKGFGFVEMATAEDAQRAINELNNTEQQGRKINVAEARPKEEGGDRGGRGFGGGRGGGGFGGGRRDGGGNRGSRY